MNSDPRPLFVSAAAEREGEEGAEDRSSSPGRCSHDRPVSAAQLTGGGKPGRSVRVRGMLRVWAMGGHLTGGCQHSDGSSGGYMA